MIRYPSAFAALGGGCCAQKPVVLPLSAVLFGLKGKRIMRLWDYVHCHRAMRRHMPADASAKLFFRRSEWPWVPDEPPVVPERISQRQPPVQGFVALHVPRQTGSRLACFCNCRAETVPAQRTAVAIAARNVFLILLLMIHSHFQ
jgi:hypothetical protein